MKIYQYPSYRITVSAGGSVAVFGCGARASLRELSEAICSAYGIVQDRACFFFTGTEPWEGEVFSDSAELPSELSCRKNAVGRSLAEKGAFLYQLGYDAELLFVCTPEGTEEKMTGVTLLTPPGLRASQIPPAGEEGLEGEDEDAEEIPDLPQAEHPYTERELLIDRYLHAAVALYGIVGRKKAHSLIAGYEPSLSGEEIEAAFEVLPPPDGKGDYTLVEDEFLYTGLAEFQTGEYFLLKEAQKGSRFRELPKEEFLAFADGLYIEPKEELSALEKSLDGFSPDPAYAAECICRMLEGYIAPQEAVELEERILKTVFPAEKKASVLTAAASLNAALPRWEKRGFPICKKSTKNHL